MVVVVHYKFNILQVWNVNNKYCKTWISCVIQKKDKLSRWLKKTFFTLNNKSTYLLSLSLLGFSWILPSTPIPEGRRSCAFTRMLWCRWWGRGRGRRCILWGVRVGLHTRSLSKEVWFWNEAIRVPNTFYYQIQLTIPLIKNYLKLTLWKHNLPLSRP